MRAPDHDDRRSFDGAVTQDPTLSDCTDTQSRTTLMWSPHANNSFELTLLGRVRYKPVAARLEEASSRLHELADESSPRSSSAASSNCLPSCSNLALDVPARVVWSVHASVV